MVFIRTIPGVIILAVVIVALWLVSDVGVYVLSQLEKLQAAL